MSDINFGKVLKGVAKGAAKLASSYMAESAKTLSHNSHLTEEARDQYAELSDSFSDFRDRLDQSDRTEDDSEDSSFSFYDVHDSFAGTVK